MKTAYSNNTEPHNNFFLWDSGFEKKFSFKQNIEFFIQILIWMTLMAKEKENLIYSSNGRKHIHNWLEAILAPTLYKCEQCHQTIQWSERNEPTNIPIRFPLNPSKKMHEKKGKKKYKRTHPFNRFVQAKQHNTPHTLFMHVSIKLLGFVVKASAFPNVILEVYDFTHLEAQSFKRLSSIQIREMIFSLEYNIMLCEWDRNFWVGISRTSIRVEFTLISRFVSSFFCIFDT